MAYDSLRVLGRQGMRILGDGHVIRQLREWHEPQEWNEPPQMRAFPRAPFDVGDFRVMPIEVTRMFERQGTKMRFHLDAAPAHRASEVVEI